MAFVITKGSLFLAQQGLAANYTNNISDARKFATEQAAIDACCGNESVQDIELIFDKYRT